VSEQEARTRELALWRKFRFDLWSSGRVAVVPQLSPRDSTQRLACSSPQHLLDAAHQAADDRSPMTLHDKLVEADLAARGLVPYRLEPPAWRASLLSKSDEAVFPGFFPTHAAQDENQTNETIVKQGFTGRSIVQVRSIPPRLCM
jgi:hypothetical protein